MKKMQNKLNKLDERFKPKAGKRVSYQQPKRINGKDTYQQPRKQN